MQTGTELYLKDLDDEIRYIVECVFSQSFDHRVCTKERYSP